MLRMPTERNYHATLTVTSREPLLGMLVIPENNPALTRVELTVVLNAMAEEIAAM